MEPKKSALGGMWCERRPLGLCCIVIEASQVFQTGPVTELVLVLVVGKRGERGTSRHEKAMGEGRYLKSWGEELQQQMTYFCLNCGWPLSAQHLDGLEDVHHALVSHPLQHNTEGDEHASPSYSSTICKHI